MPKLAAVRLSRLYLDAVSAGADLVLSACSSVGDVAAAAQPLLQQLGVPLIRIDELMARQAVLAHERIAVLATLPST
ncbi:MAG: Asp/Glu/hydantoin racemase, partial [Bacillota bacterium]|nr:Asp/Glu/hydantoin racemase [Bacillota bacterium]